MLIECKGLLIVQEGRAVTIVTRNHALVTSSGNLEMKRTPFVKIVGRLLSRFGMISRYQ